VRPALEAHAETLVDAELRKLPADQRDRLGAVCRQVAAAVVDGVLDNARDEPRLAAALVSIYGPQTRISAWPAEAVRRA
jgi:hypothetical protein